jgi:predicted RNA-binding Zn-ribbon protein involved in translation (DUF1610 family)
VLASCPRFLLRPATIPFPALSLGLATSLVLRHVRALPHACPACGSTRLSPQRGVNDSVPDIEWKRPVCEKCGWTAIRVKL